MKFILIGILLISNIAMATGPQTISPDPIPRELMYDPLPVGGYVASIDTPTYTNAYTKRVLTKFGASGGRHAVLFTSESLIIRRKITITEVKTCEFKEDDGKIGRCVGRAECGMTECKIELLTGKTRKEYRLVLLHEYMHCMGFQDLKDKDKKYDLMYYSENKVSEKNIKEYAKKAHERQPVWKNLKN